MRYYHTSTVPRVLTSGLHTKEVIKSCLSERKKQKEKHALSQISYHPSSYERYQNPCLSRQQPIPPFVASHDSSLKTARPPPVLRTTPGCPTRPRDRAFNTNTVIVHAKVESKRTFCISLHTRHTCIITHRVGRHEDALPGTDDGTR